MRSWIAALAALAFLVPPAAAQGARDVQLPAGQAWRHAPTGLTVPVELDGLPRVGISALEADQLDEYVNFENEDRAEALTVYVYRHVTGSIPVWFDRARWAIEKRGVYGEPVAIDRPANFVPPGQRNASGMITVYATNGSPYRSTAVAMIPLGPEWIVKLRYSSKAHAAIELERRLQRVIAALGWPANIAPQPVSEPIRTCEAALEFAGRAAAIPPAAQDAVAAGIMAIPLPEKDGTPPRIWCRDPGTLTGIASGAIYRPGGATDAYLLALSDAGRGVNVARQLDTAPGWAVMYVQMRNTIVFELQNRLPSPQQAVEVVNSGRRLVTVTTWGESRVEINSGLLPPEPPNT